MGMMRALRKSSRRNEDIQTAVRKAGDSSRNREACPGENKRKRRETIEHPGA